MQRGSRRFWGYGLAIALAVVPLSACSMASLGGGSAFGSKKMQVAEVPGLADYTAARALGEAKDHFRNGNFGHSATLYKRVVELSPKDPEGYVGLGASYDRLRRFDLSDRVYASLFDLSGATVQYHNNVGYSYLLRGDLTQALASFRRAKKLDPENVVVANNIQILATAAARARA